jgi:hypothetical protein
MLGKLRRRLGDMSTISQLLEGAEAIARREGIAQPAAEHLVLAALALDDGTGEAALRRVGTSSIALTTALREQHDEALASVGVVADDALIDASLPEPTASTGVHRSEPSAQELFRRAGADARSEGGGLLGAHVLRAAADLEHGTVARAFRHLGVDRHALRECATAEIAASRSR